MKGDLLMKTVQNNSNITKSVMQEFLKNNQEKLGLSEDNVNKIIKSLKRKKITKEKIKIFYKECFKKTEDVCLTLKSKHLTQGERIIIEVLFTADFSNNFISLFLNRNRSTIGRELNNNKKIKDDISCTKSYKKEGAYKNIETYSAKDAHLNYISNRARCKKKFILEKNPKLLSIIIALLKGDIDQDTNTKIRLSPKAISAYLKMKNIKGTLDYISYSAIYNAANSRAFGFTSNELPFGRKYYKAIKEHAQFKQNTERKKEYSIEKMPVEVKEKRTDTHFEGDSIIGKRAGKNNTLITLVNTSSKFLFIERADRKTSEAFIAVLDKLEREIPELSKIMETLLLDNGCEFSDIDGILRSCKDNERERFALYFAHPYTSCERGCNENKNRQVRIDFAKSTLVETMSDLDILNISRRINNTPRECLGWKTALQVFEEQLTLKNIDTNFLDKYRIGKMRYLVA